jgi:rubrerythrin
LYVAEEIARGEGEAEPIPDRRFESPPKGEAHDVAWAGATRSGLPVWRCKVCGYLCARTRPPLKCPICKADRDRFEPLS